MPWRAPRVAGVAGVTGAVVRWNACMDTVAGRRPDAVLEVGPGTTPARRWRERFPALPARSCDGFASAREVLGRVAGASGEAGQARRKKTVSRSALSWADLPIRTESRP